MVSKGLLSQFRFMEIKIPIELHLLLRRKYQLHYEDLYKDVRMELYLPDSCLVLKRFKLRSILLQLRSCVWDL